MQERPMSRLTRLSTDSNEERGLIRALNTILLLLAAGVALEVLSLVALLAFELSAAAAVTGLAGTVSCLVGTVYVFNFMRAKTKQYNSTALTRPQGSSRQVSVRGSLDLDSQASETPQRDEKTSPAEQILPLVRALTLADSPDQILDALRQHVLFGVDYIGLVQVIAVDADDLQTETLAEWSRSGFILNADCPLEMLSWSGNQPFIVEDIELIETPDPALRRYMQNVLQVSSLHCYPLLARGTMAGFLILGNRASRQSTEKEAQTLRAVSGLLGDRIESASTLADMSDELSRVNALYGALQKMSSTHTMQELYEVALVEMARFSAADMITLYMAGPDPARKISYVEAAGMWRHGNIDIAVEATQYALSEVPILAQFPQSQSALMFNDVAHDPRLDEGLRQNLSNSGTRSMMLVPILADEIWLGAVVAERAVEDSFSSYVLQVVSSLADQAGAAILRYLLEKQYQFAAKRERFLREVSMEIRSGSDQRSILRLVDERLQALLGRPIETIRDARLGQTELLTDQEWQLVQDVDRQAQMAVSNLYLMERTQRNVAHEQMMSEITAELQRTTGVESVLETTVRTLRSVLSDYDIALRLETDEAPEEESLIEDME